MLQISRRVEYALRASIFLAALPSGRVATFGEISEREDVPRDFLAKILRSLVDAQLVVSTRGSQGGFALARPADSITFLDVIEAADGPVALNNCTLHGDGCSLVDQCGMKSVWQAGEAAMLAVFRSTTLASLSGRTSGVMRDARLAATFSDPSAS